MVDAVGCPTEIQRGMAEREAEVPDERRITLRIGGGLADFALRLQRIELLFEVLPRTTCGCRSHSARFRSAALWLVFFIGWPRD